MLFRSFLHDHGIAPGDIGFWVVHPGGPRILEAVSESLGLDDEALAPSWAAWERHGNVSSATVFFILRQLRALAPPPAGTLGVMVAFGPGVTCEMVLLRSGGWLARRDHS